MNDDFADNSDQEKEKQVESVRQSIESNKSLEEPCTSSKVEEQRKRKSNNSEKNQKERSKHQCPFPDCTSSVIHLPRHMRKCHGWSPRKARSVLNSFGLRKAKDTDVRKTKRTYKSVMCPVSECNAVVKRLHNHLTAVHKMKTGSKIYNECKRAAVCHEVDPLSSCSESSAEFSDASSSSSKSYKPPEKKTKAIHRSSEKSFYHAVYSDSDISSEGERLNEASLTSGNEDSGLNDLSFPLNDKDSNDPECESEINQDKDSDAVTPDYDKELRTVFDRYESWLQCSDGGDKDQRSALQCRRQVELVVNYIGDSNQSLQCLLQKNRLRDEWLAKFGKEKQPGTVKSYLGSLHYFYTFLKCENVDVGVSVEQISSLSQQVKLWSRSFRKKSLNRFWEKRMEDISSMRTPQQVKEFDTSKVARAAVTLLGEYKDKEDDMLPTQPEYTSVRDYLLTVLCINNGSRSGTLANMTLVEFGQATKEDGCYVVRVKDHKTFTTHGPVNVVFSASLYNYTQIFIEKFRNTLEGVSTDGHSYVFLSANQRKLSSSQVGYQIGSCWGKVFGKGTTSGGATAFRKAAVSAVNEHNEDMRGDLANLMVHKQSTADRYYLLKSKGKSAVRTSKELSRIMRSSAADEDQPADNELNGSRQRGSDNWSGRRKWTAAEIAELETAFSSNIESQSITMEQVRKTVKMVPILQGISPQKIRDKIRSYFGREVGENEESSSLPSEKESLGDRLKRAGLDKPRNDGGMLDEEITSQDELVGDEKGNALNAEEDNVSDDAPDEEDCLGSEYAPTSYKKTMQSLLTIEEDATFSGTFSKLIRSSKPIETKKVVETIKKQPKLCHLLKSFTPRQMADKVRSLRKASVLANSKKKLGKKTRK